MVEKRAGFDGCRVRRQLRPPLHRERECSIEYWISINFITETSKSLIRAYEISQAVKSSFPVINEHKKTNERAKPGIVIVRTYNISATACLIKKMFI